MPLGARTVTGVVWSARSAAATTSNRSSRSSTRRRSPGVARLHRLDGALDAGSARHALRMAIRAGEVAEPPAPKFGLIATGKPPTRITEARARVLAALAENERANAESRACRARGCSTSVIDGLVADGALEAEALAPESGAAHSIRTFVPGPQRRSARRGRRSHPPRRRPRVLGHPARGRDRIGKDGSLFRGGRRGAAAEAAGACSCRRSRSPHNFSIGSRRASAQAGRMAFRPDRAPARARLAAVASGEARVDCRRALGACFCRSPTRPHRRR